jgi:hypothetical protein
MCVTQVVWRRPAVQPHGNCFATQAGIDHNAREMGYARRVCSFRTECPCQ